MINFKAFVVIVLFSIPHCYVWRRKQSLDRGDEGGDGRECWRTIDAVFKAKERKEKGKKATWAVCISELP